MNKRLFLYQKNYNLEKSAGINQFRGDYTSQGFNSITPKNLGGMALRTGLTMALPAAAKFGYGKMFGSGIKNVEKSLTKPVSNALTNPTHGAKLLSAPAADFKPVGVQIHTPSTSSSSIAGSTIKAPSTPLSGMSKDLQIKAYPSTQRLGGTNNGAMTPSKNLNTQGLKAIPRSNWRSDNMLQHRVQLKNPNLWKD